MSAKASIRAAALAAILTISATAASGYDNVVTYSGQGFAGDGFGNWDLETELCGTANGAEVDGPYLLWNLTAASARNADITGPWGTAAMTKTGNGVFKFVSGWYDPNLLVGNVVATYDGRPRNAQLVVSHGCRPFDDGAWCSPGFWRNATDAAWALTGFTRSDLFNLTVHDAFFGATFAEEPTLDVVLTENGGAYKGAGVAGTDPRSHEPALNAFNATGAFLTDQIPGYVFDPAVMLAGGSDACPIDHFGNFKQ